MHNQWFGFVGVRGNGNLFEFPFNCLFIGKWFTKHWKGHIYCCICCVLSSSVLKTSLCIDFCMFFALGLLNEKTQLTKSLSAYYFWAQINTLSHVSWDSVIHAVSGSLSLMDVWWGCNFSALSFSFCPFCFQQQQTIEQWIMGQV